MRWLFVSLALLISFAYAQESAKEKKPPEKRQDKFAELTKDAEKLEGLFTLYRKPDKVLMEVRPD